MAGKHHIVRLEVRYRPSDTEGAWSYVTGLDPKTDNFHLYEQDVEIGREYEIQARQWNDCGLASEWSSLLHTVAGGTDAPWGITAIDDFRVADGIRFKLTFDHTGKLPAGVYIQAHKAPDVSGSPGAFVDTGKTYGPSNTFTIDDDGSATSWYKFRTVDQRGNVSDFSSQISSRGKVVADGADVTLDQIDGDGNDVLPANFAVFVGNKVPKFAQKHNITASLTTSGGSVAQFAQSLRLTVTGTAGEIDIDFTNVVNKANIPLQPNSKWNYTCQVKSSVAGRTFVPRLVDSSGTVLASGAAITVPSAVTIEGPVVINLSASSATKAYLRLRLTGGGWAVNDTLDINWHLVERKAGNATKTPSRSQPGLTSMDDLVDGADRASVSLSAVATDDSGYLDFSQAAYLNKDVDHVADGATYGRPLLARLSAGKPLIDFSEGIHLNKILDNIADGATYGRPLLTRLNAGKPFVDLSESINLNRTMAYISDDAGSSRYAVSAIDGGTRKALIDFTHAHTNKNLDNLADGATYGRPLLTRLSAGKPLIDFSEGIHLNKTIDNVADGATYARVKTGALTSGNVDLALSGVVGKTATNITYTGGATVDSLKPAAVGADVTLDQLAGVGVNLMPLAYSLFGMNSLIPTFGQTTHIAQALAASNFIYGYLRLNLTFDGSGAPRLALAPTLSGTNLSLRNKKQIVSVLVQNVGSNNNTFDFAIGFFDSTNTQIAISGTVVPTSDHAANTNGVYYGVIDLTAASTTAGFLKLVWNSTPTAGIGAIQGVQIEEQKGTLSTPSAYTIPTEGTSDISGVTQSASGSIPPIIPDMTFSYSRTTTSITVSWSAFTIRRPDGSTVSVGSGSQAVTGLSSGTTYFFYPYWDEITQAIAFVSASQGTPAIFGLAAAGSRAIQQAQLGRIPLSTTACSAATTSAGTGGGTGGGISNCLHPRQALLINRDERVTMIEAQEARVGDKVWTRAHGWVRIRRAYQDRHDGEWTEVVFNEGPALWSTPSEPVYLPDGDIIRAKAMPLSAVVQGGKRPLEVLSVRKFMERLDKVCLEIDSEDHRFCLSEDGAEIANTIYKP